MSNSTTVRHSSNVMQPPLLNGVSVGPLRRHIAELIHQAQETSAIKQREKLAAIASAVKKNRTETDYRVLVADWFRSIPPAARQRRYRIEELLLIFAGRYRDRPAIRLLAEALRANGFIPRRDWSVAGRNSRYWLPPQL